MKNKEELLEVLRQAITTLSIDEATAFIANIIEQREKTTKESLLIEVLSINDDLFENVNPDPWGDSDYERVRAIRHRTIIEIAEEHNIIFQSNDQSQLPNPQA